MLYWCVAWRVRKSMLLENLEREATGIILNPTDWRAITTTKTNAPSTGNGLYILGGVLGGGPGGVAAQTIWGVPVAITTAQPPGKFTVGDFSGAVVCDRMDARIDISTEHSDFFIKNMVAIRAEERLALVVKRADYFVYGSF